MKLTNNLLPILIFLFSTGLLLTACSSGQEQQPNDSAVLEVQASRATFKEVPEQFGYTGTVSGEKRVNLSTKIMGTVISLSVESGDPVSRGEVLAVIQSRNIQAQKEQVKANLDEAEVHLNNVETNFNRIKALYEDSSATRKEFDDISTQYAAAKAQVRALNSRLAEINDLLGYSRITAPIDGYVVATRIEEGDLANPGQVLLTIENTQHLEMNITVPESEIGKFAVGDTVLSEVSAAGKRFTGIIESVVQSGDAVSRQFEVKVSVPESVASRGGVKPGMYARIILQKGTARYLTVPQEALITRGQLRGVFTVNETNELMLRWVRTGKQIEGEVEILSGLSEGELFVERYDPNLKEGMKVSVKLNESEVKEL